ncbi:hypothetical protein SKAU_G00164430 [Synaphobranchus kaupii]|uniref:Uncharacterized protein n=1 Tax=Synaphobranchus kaupii TaxID=118154 RepID=A0A9Q1FJ52_SYNKA|nr:hypothetical protein SKAU_G00164430 [Synaphobranchus kaupii]
MVNMNNVSWGTRETTSQAKDGPIQTVRKNVKFEKKCRCCCWNVEFQVNEDEKVMVAPGPTEAPITTKPTSEKHPDQEERKKSSSGENSKCNI